MRYSMVAAAIIGSVVAAQHKAHVGFHNRRHDGQYEAADPVCTVYTTVYETAPAPSVPAESTVHVNTPPAVKSSTCTDEVPSVQTPPPAPEASKPGYPAVPEHSQPAHPEKPTKDENTPEYPAQPPTVPEGDKPKETPSTPEGGKPEYPATTPEAGQPEYPGAPPQESTTCTDEEKHTPATEVPGVPQSTPVVPEGGKGTPTPEGGKPEYPATTPEAGKPEYPAGTPEVGTPESTSCTDEENNTPATEVPSVPQSTPVVPEGGKGTPTPDGGKPEYPATTPEAGKPEYPAGTPEVGTPESTTCTDEEGKTPATEVPGVPQNTPTVPEGGKGTPTPEAGKPEYPANTPEGGKPEHPTSTAVAGTPEYTPVVPSSTKEAEKPSNTPVPQSSKPADTPKPVPSSSKAADKPKTTGGYSSGDRIVTNGDKWAMTYTPYANSGDCKSKAEVQSDIKKISELGFTTIRSYSTDCGVFENVVPECQKYGLKVIYGIFLEAGGKDGKGPFSEYANNQLKEITDNAPKDSVSMVIVGNECIFNNNCKPDELGSYIDHVRDELHTCGFPTDIAVTTTEPVGTWEENGAALCSHIDIFAVQVHPYFTQSISAEDAGDFAAQQLEQASKVCPEAAEKGAYITEIGWPSAGQSNGKAHAGKEEQKIAMKKIMDKVGAESCIFSFQNDGWKEPGNLDVEQHFGCADALGY